jgi:hypothetical protein
VLGGGGGRVRELAEIYWCETINYVYVATLHLVGTNTQQLIQIIYIYTVLLLLPVYTHSTPYKSRPPVVFPYIEATSLDWKISVFGKSQCFAIRLADEKSRIY